MAEGNFTRSRNDLSFFSSTIPTKKPTATDINELIQTNHELGRVDQETESEIKLTAYDRMTHNVLSFLLKAVFWVILPFILLIFITEGFDFSILLFPCNGRVYLYTYF